MFSNLNMIFLRICIFLKNDDFVENIFGKKWIFFLAILTFFMAALDAQQISCGRDIFFFFLSLFDQNFSIFCQKVAKVERTICDCN